MRVLCAPTRHRIVGVDHPVFFSTPTYQETAPWPYAQSWDTPVLDAGALSENPPSTSLHAQSGLVSASPEGSTFASSLPPASAVQTHGHYFSSSQGYGCSLAYHQRHHYHCYRHHCHRHLHFAYIPYVFTDVPTPLRRLQAHHVTHAIALCATART